MKKLTPRDYLEKYYPGANFCPKTIINWIKKGKLTGEQTPTGRWLVVISEAQPSNVEKLFRMLET